MRLVEVALRRETQRVSVTARVECNLGPTPIDVSFWYPESAASFVSPEADAFVPVLLLPAMAAGEALEIVPRISPRLMGRIPQLQEIFAAWYPQTLRAVEFTAMPRAGSVPAAGSNVATFFAGGVDAFYTLLKHVRRLRPEPRRITHILFMRGIETPRRETRGDDVVIHQAEEVARETGVELLVGETNLREHFPLVWGMYCGAGLAGTALSLSSGFSDVLVPSSLAYSEFDPWGSHPLVDELWSNECTTVRSDGAEAYRAEKIERIVAADPVAQRYLRVCTHNDGGGFNCGRCAKCVRTMVSLRACGHLEHMATFPHDLPSDLEALLRTDALYFVEQNLRLCERTGRDSALRTSLERVLRHGRQRTALRLLAESSLPAPVLSRFRDWKGRGRTW